MNKNNGGQERKRNGCWLCEMHTTYSLWCGERGIQTPGTDKPFTGFRVRPNRSLWHLSWLLEPATKVRKKIEKGSLQIPVAPGIKYNNVTRVMIGLHLTLGGEDFADIRSSPNPEYRRANRISPLGSSPQSFHFEVWICLG